MKVRIIVCFIIVLFITSIALFTDRKIEQGEIRTAVPVIKNKESDKELLEIEYQRDGIKARYPNFDEKVVGANAALWNQIINEDFQSILSIYSFNPFPELTQTPGTNVPIFLNIVHHIKLNSGKLTSIFYEAAFSSIYSAHPSDLVYTTNIDKKNNKRLRLSDFIQLDQDFVKDFRTWQIQGAGDNNPEINQAIKDYLANISDEDLLSGFKAADQISSKNIWDIYSYYTEDKLGISIGVPNYAGDHAEFEKSYNDIEKFIKPEYR